MKVQIDNVRITKDIITVDCTYVTPAKWTVVDTVFILPQAKDELKEFWDKLNEEV